MTDYGYKYARTITLVVTDNLLSTSIKMSKFVHPTNLPSEVSDKAMQLFKSTFNWTNRVRGLGISLSDFTNEEQLSFDFDVKDHERKETLEKTVENIRKRFGRSAISRAVVLREEKFQELDIKYGHSLPNGKK